MTEAAGCVEEPALPLPRLDLHAGRRAQGHAEFRQRMPFDAARMDWYPWQWRCGRTGCSCAWMPKDPASKSFSGARRRDSPPCSCGELHWFERRALFLRLQLEGVRRQLPRRRLPRATPAQGPEQRARLQEVHHRERPAPLPAVQPDGEGRRPRRFLLGARRRPRAVLLVHPNFMVNWYEGQMDTNLVLPLGLDRTEVIFDFYFADVSEAARRTQPRQHRRRQHHPGRGHGDLQVGAARPELARVFRRPAVGAARGGRAPVPSLAAWGPGSGSRRLACTCTAGCAGAQDLPIGGDAHYAPAERRNDQRAAGSRCFQAGSGFRNSLAA